MSTVQANLVSFFMLINNLDLDFSLIYKSFNAIEAYDIKNRFSSFKPYSKWEPGN